jgi:hypothetical protein
MCMIWITHQQIWGGGILNYICRYANREMLNTTDVLWIMSMMDWFTESQNYVVVLIGVSTATPRI